MEMKEQPADHQGPNNTGALPASRRQDCAAARWNFLEQGAHACSVVTRRMELIYLNAAARLLVPQKWFGCRCWEVLPVANSNCAVRCPVIRAVATSRDISYCEETVYPDGKTLTLGVAVIPLPGATDDEGRALIVLRPRPAGQQIETIRDEFLADARKLRARTLRKLGLVARSRQRKPGCKPREKTQIAGDGSQRTH